MSSKSPIKIDALGVVRSFGGPTELRFALERHSLGNPSGYTITKWIERKRIPGEWLMSIMVLARLLRVSFSPLTFVEKDSLSAQARRAINKADAPRV